MAVLNSKTWMKQHWSPEDIRHADSEVWIEEVVRNISVVLFEFVITKLLAGRCSHIRQHGETSGKTKILVVGHLNMCYPVARYVAMYYKVVMIV
jgi:hypothetical protein